jgi:hypothetical protein
VTHTAESLAGKTIEELRGIAQQLNIKPHHKAKPETLIYQIMQQPQSALNAAMPAEGAENDPMQHKAAQPVAPVVANTEDSIREAIEAYTKKDGFVATFPGDGTWIFKFQGAEDSGNMSIPLRVIKQRAAIVARGASRLMSMGNDGTYKGYADTIIHGGR